MKVIASSLRKGNVVEMEGKLYVVLKSEKVSAHIGGMQIIGTTQQLQMVILLIIIRQ